MRKAICLFLVLSLLILALPVIEQPILDSHEDESESYFPPSQNRVPRGTRNPGLYDGWDYKTEINITEVSGNDLKDYQVLLNISYNSNMQLDFGDLRFTYLNNSNDTEVIIDYWIEEFHSTHIDSTGNSTELIFLFGRLTDDNCDNAFEHFSKVHAYDVNNNIWIYNISNIPSVLSSNIAKGAIMANYNNKVYAFDNDTGGFYDPLNNTWNISLTPPPSNVWGNDFTYTQKPFPVKWVTDGMVIGEHIWFVNYSKAIRYNVTNDSWDTDFSEMNTQREWTTSTNYGDILYVFGGAQTNGGYTVFKSVEAYNTSNNTWFPRSDMLDYNDAFALERVNNIIYTFGGVNGTGLGDIFNKSFAYNITNNTWYNISYLPYEMKDTLGSATYFNNKIWVFGGLNYTEYPMNDFIAYDITNDSYSIVRSMPDEIFMTFAQNLTTKIQRNGYALIWVKVPYINASENETIYMYYGNSEVDTTSNGTNVFLFFDDFEDGDTSRFEISTGSTGSSYTISEDHSYTGYNSRNASKGIELQQIATTSTWVNHNRTTFNLNETKLKTIFWIKVQNITWRSANWATRDSSDTNGIYSKIDTDGSIFCHDGATFVDTGLDLDTCWHKITITADTITDTGNISVDNGELVSFDFMNALTNLNYTSIASPARASGSFETYYDLFAYAKYIYPEPTTKSENTTYLGSNQLYNITLIKDIWNFKGYPNSTTINVSTLYSQIPNCTTIVGKNMTTGYWYTYWPSIGFIEKWDIVFGDALFIIVDINVTWQVYNHTESTNITEAVWNPKVFANPTNKTASSTYSGITNCTAIIGKNGTTGYWYTYWPNVGLLENRLIKFGDGLFILTVTNSTWDHT